MGAQILELPPDPTGTREARIILARGWSNDAEFHDARMHILNYGSPTDQAFARRASRERRAQRRLTPLPMPAIPAASLGGDKPAPSEGHPFLPAAAPACSGRGATASAGDDLSPAEALSLHVERWVTGVLVTMVAVCLAFLIGFQLGGAIATAAIPSL